MVPKKGSTRPETSRGDDEDMPPFEPVQAPLNVSIDDFMGLEEDTEKQWQTRETGQKR